MNKYRLYFELCTILEVLILVLNIISFFSDM